MTQADGHTSASPSAEDKNGQMVDSAITCHGVLLGFWVSEALAFFI